MRLRFLFALSTAFWVAAIGAAAQDTSPVTVVMRRLDNPRGLAFGPEGGLYVAEAGRGPSDSSCFTNPDQQQCRCVTRNSGTFCSGPTGAVSRLWQGRQERLVSELPSWATSSGRAEGPNDVALSALLGNGCARAKSIQVQTGSTSLIRPTSITVGPDGALYVSNRGTFVGTGEVLRIEP